MDGHFTTISLWRSGDLDTTSLANLIVRLDRTIRTNIIYWVMKHCHADWFKFGQSLDTNIFVNENVHVKMDALVWWVGQKFGGGGGGSFTHQQIAAAQQSLWQ